jgi:hypothetical protein
MGILIIAGAVVIIIIIAAILSLKQPKEKKIYVLLFNRRVRRIIEKPLSRYEEIPSWKEIARVEGSQLDGFLQYLTQKGVYTNYYREPVSEALPTLQYYFKKYMLEIVNENQ